MQKAILACGCFWGPEEKFRKINGITSAEVGYCGGNNSNVSYEEVCKACQQCIFWILDPLQLHIGALSLN